MGDLKMNILSEMHNKLCLHIVFFSHIGGLKKLHFFRQAGQ